MSGNELFELTHPEYSQPWNTNVVVNGEIRCEVRAPHSRCTGCAYLPDFGIRIVELSPELRQQLISAAASGSRIGTREANLLRVKLYRECPDEIGRGEFGYGTRFPPFRWQVPSVPNTSGFYWNPATTLIGERIQKLLAAKAAPSLRFSRVQVAAVGQLDRRGHSGWPLSDQVEVLMKSTKTLSDPTSVGDFYVLEPIHNTRYDRHREVCTSCCPVCGRGIIDEPLAAKLEADIKVWRKERVLPRRYVPDMHIFESHIFGRGLIVSSKIVECLDQAGAVNVVWKPIRVVAD